MNFFNNHCCRKITTAVLKLQQNYPILKIIFIMHIIITLYSCENNISYNFKNNTDLEIIVYYVSEEEYEVDNGSTYNPETQSYDENTTTEYDYHYNSETIKPGERKYLKIERLSYYYVIYGGHVLKKQATSKSLSDEDLVIEVDDFFEEQEAN